MANLIFVGSPSVTLARVEGEIGAAYATRRLEAVERVIAKVEATVRRRSGVTGKRFDVDADKSPTIKPGDVVVVFGDNVVTLVGAARPDDKKGIPRAPALLYRVTLGDKGHTLRTVADDDGHDDGGPNDVAL